MSELNNSKTKLKPVKLVNNVLCTEELYVDTSCDGGLGIFIYKACEKFGDNIYQICSDTGETETFNSYQKRSIKTAIEMQKRGIKKGDVVVCCSYNTLNSSVPVAGALFLGAKIASLDPTLSERDTLHLLNLVEPTIIFIESDSIHLVNEYVKNTQTKVVVYESEDFQEFLKDSPEETTFKPVYIEDLQETAVIFFSSGTTGLPKGICCCHSAIHYHSYLMLLFTSDPTTLLHLTTFYWITAIMLYITQMFKGTRRVLVHKKHYDAPALMSVFEKRKVTFAFLATQLSYQLTAIENFDKFDLSSLKTVIFGGGPITAEQMVKTKKLMPNAFVSAGYGMTELSGFGTAFSINDRALADKYPNSCGVPVCGNNIKVVDTETGQILGPNQSGEIRFLAKHKLVGYYKQDNSQTFDDEGWLKTGDVGHYNEDCCLFVYDRIKEMFKYQSWHIVPASIESVVKEHPDVLEAVVFGTPSELYGDLPTAAVTLRADCKITVDDIAEFVNNKVLDRQKLRGGVYIVKEFPKTPTGKLVRRKVKDIIRSEIN